MFSLFLVAVVPQEITSPGKVTGLQLQSTFLEIHFIKLTKLAKLTNVRSSVSLGILHPHVLCKKFARMNFMNEVHSKAFLQNTL